MCNNNMVDSFTHHCQIVPEGAQGYAQSYENCQTNPGHKDFIPVHQFKREFLTSPRDEYEANEKGYLENMIDSTVRILVTHTSPYRPDTYPNSSAPYSFIEFRGDFGRHRCGTGYIPYHDVKKIGDKTCPCDKCTKSKWPMKTYWEIIVSTATHVVFDENEAENTIVELFYDSNSREGVKCLCGVGVLGDTDRRYQTDYCLVLCVTHDAQLADTLIKLLEQRMVYKDLFAPTGILISHPHGGCKMVSFGIVLHEFFLPENKADILPLVLQHDMVINFSDAEEKSGQSNSEFHRVKNVFLSVDGQHILWHPKITGPVDNLPHDDSSSCPPSQGNSSPFWEAIANWLELHSIPYSQDSVILELDNKIAILPPKPEVNIQRFFFDDRGNDDPSFWGTISPGTKLYCLSDHNQPAATVFGEILFHIPKATNFASFKSFHCLSYSMSACPGSSGALVCGYHCPIDSTENLFAHAHHFGSFRDQNFSGLVNVGKTDFRCMRNKMVQLVDRIK